MSILLLNAAMLTAVANESLEADIEAFVRNGCVHCEQAEVFFAQLQQEQPGLKIVIHNVDQDSTALSRLETIAQSQQLAGSVRLPTFWVRGQLIVGYTDEAGSGNLIRHALEKPTQAGRAIIDNAGTCEAQASMECGPGTETPSAEPDVFELTFWGRRVGLDEVGLPVFTVVMGLLDGFNPCSMWVLLLMISMLAPMKNRWRMFAVAGAFVAVEGIAYFIFMAAWLNLFLLIGLSRASELAIAAIAIVAGGINLKDFIGVSGGVSLSIPTSAKPGIYAQIRRILQADNLWGAMLGAVVLAVLVQIVEFLCTSGFPALYTRILTLRQLQGLDYYAYLLLYNLAYMLDDIMILTIGIVTLSQHRLQEKEGRLLKLISGLVMLGLGLYLGLH